MTTFSFIHNDEEIVIRHNIQSKCIVQVGNRFAGYVRCALDVAEFSPIGILDIATATAIVKAIDKYELEISNVIPEKTTQVINDFYSIRNKGVSRKLII